MPLLPAVLLSLIPVVLVAALMYLHANPHHPVALMFRRERREWRRQLRSIRRLPEHRP